MKTAYVNGRILTGYLDENGKMVCKTGTVIVENGRFTSVCEENADTKDCRIVDLKGKTMLPGLINMHVHIASAGGPSKQREKPINYKKLFDTLSRYPFVMAVYRRMQEKNVRKLLYSGVTTIRTVGGILDFDGLIRDDVKAGRKIGPRMLVCNTAVSVPGGHFAGSLATEAENPQMAVRDVYSISKTHPDWIKLMVTGGVMDASAEGEPGVLKMAPEIVKAACDEAHRLGFKVCAHVESPEGVKVAVENGVDSIEHGAMLTPEIVRMMKEKGVNDVCTLSPALPLAFCESISSEMCMRNAKTVINGIRECAKTCLAEGIPVGLGTDTGCPYTTQYNTWRELALWVKYLDVSPDFALHSATLKNAGLLSLDRETGSIEKGKSADFVVTEKNPLDDLTALKNPYMVSVFGKEYTKIRIKKSRAVEELLDGVM